MKRKGFTLVELIITILVIGIIAIIVTPNVINTVSGSKQKAYDTTIQNIKTATSMYLSEFTDNLRWFVSSNETGDESDEEWTCVQINKLIEKGYLKDDLKVSDNAFVINPENGTVTKTSDFVELRRNKDSRSLLRDKITLESNNCNGGYDTTNPEINITLTYEDGTVYNGQNPIWTDKNIIQTITASDANGIISLQMKKGAGEYENIESVEKNNNSWILKMIQMDEGSVDMKIRAIDYFGHETEKSYKMLIDKTAPTCSINLTGNKASDSNEWYIGDVKVDLVYEDISRVDYDLSTVNTPTYNNVSPTLNQTENTAGTTYYAHVKDQVGHINACSVTIKKDSVNPTAPVLTAYPSTFIKSKSSPAGIPPASAIFGTSGGTTTCTCNGSVCSNLNSVSNGTNNIVCTSTGNNGLSSTSSRSVYVRNCQSRSYCYTCGGYEYDECGRRITCESCCECSSDSTCSSRYGSDYTCNGCSCVYNPPPVCECTNSYQCSYGYSCDGCNCIYNYGGGSGYYDDDDDDEYEEFCPDGCGYCGAMYYCDDTVSCSCQPAGGYTEEEIEDWLNGGWRN